MAGPNGSRASICCTRFSYASCPALQGAELVAAPMPGISPSWLVSDAKACSTLWLSPASASSDTSSSFMLGKICKVGASALAVGPLF